MVGIVTVFRIVLHYHANKQTWVNLHDFYVFNDIHLILTSKLSQEKLLLMTIIKVIPSV